MSKITTLILSLIILGATQLGAEEKLPLKEIKNVCEEYLTIFATDKDREKWQTKLESTIDQIIKDSPHYNKESAAQSILLDWASDNRSEIEAKKRKSVTMACFYFSYLIQKGYDLPGHFRKELSEDNAQKLIGFLKEQIERGDQEEQEEVSTKGGGKIIIFDPGKELSEGIPTL